MESLVLLIVIGTSIWVLVDAKSIGIGKRALNGVVDSGPWTWFWGCLLLWIVAFPMYLVKRNRYKGLDSEPAVIPSIPVHATLLSDAITQLERLSQLKEKGIITEEEFLSKKRVLLA